MERFLNVLIVPVAAMVFAAAAPSDAAAQSGGGCNQYCEQGQFCHSGGVGYCVQGYLGQTAVCSQFFDCGGGGDDLAMFPTACQRAAESAAEAAVGRFFREDVLKPFWIESAKEGTRALRSLRPSAPAVTVTS